jgi:dTDP-4-dehydrorhamnose 3,5-epimerase-like enzyme
MLSPSLISGGIATDQRGHIRFVNDFDMSQVKRFYIIENADTELIRGWRAHRTEQRWFYVIKGSFSLQTIKIDDWTSPSRDLPVAYQELHATDQHVLHMPTGYGTAFKALEPGSQLLVYADFPIDHAKEDDYTYPLDYFVNLHP